MTPAERWMAIVFGVGFTALVVADLIEGYTVAKLSVGFIVLFWFPLLAVHEIGHAVVARWLGWRVVEIAVGYGPQVARLAWGNTLIVIRAIPAGGHVIPALTKRRLARLESGLIYFAGPGIELLLVGLVALALGPDALFSSVSSTVAVAAQSLALTAFAGAVINLVPFAAAGSVSDGLGILLSASMNRDHVEALVALPYSRAAQPFIDRGDATEALRVVDNGLEAFPDNRLLEITRAVCIAAKGEQQAAMDQLQKIRDLPELGQSMEAEALHAAALVVLEAGDRSLLSEAEAACRAAIELVPSVKFEITLGRIQLEQQRFSLARTTLMHAYKATRDARLEDQCIAYLAMAGYGEGRVKEADLFFAKLRARRPGRHLLERAERMRYARADWKGAAGSES